jgi:hypothetical protein
MTRLSMTLAVALVIGTAGSPAQAQTSDRLVIAVGGARIMSDGGENPSVWGGVEANDIGNTVRWGFSQPGTTCWFSVAPGSAKADAAYGWDVALTPIKVVGDAVTFRVAWSRSRDEGKPSTGPKGDVQRTLRPGESIPLDSVARECRDFKHSIGHSVRVRIDRRPEPDRDRRLLSVRLWLVDKRDGTERSQLLTLRGLYHQAIPFYFDSLTEGPLTLDIFGDVTIAPGGSTNDVRLQTSARLTNPAASPPSTLPQSTTATVKLSPGEVVSVELQGFDVSRRDPLFFGERQLAFASRALALRIQVSQIR